MDTALPQKFPFILDRNLAKANCTGNRVCTSCDIVALGFIICNYFLLLLLFFFSQDGCQMCNNTPENYSAAYNVMVQLIAEVRAEDVPVDVMRTLLNMQVRL